MRELLKKTERLADSVSLFLANVAAIILLLLVALTVADVIGRYIFNNPVVGTVELVRISMAGIIFFSLPLMFLRNDHIIVDLFSIFRRGWIAWVSSVLILLVTAYIAYKVGDRVYDYAVRAFEDKDVTEYISIPQWPIVGFIAISLFSAAAMSLLRLCSIILTPGKVPEAQGEDNL